jgi:serine/threonine protein kinase
MEVKKLDIVCFTCGRTHDTSGVEPLSSFKCRVCGADIVAPFTLGRFILTKALGPKSVFNIFEAYDTERNVKCEVAALDSATPGAASVLRVMTERAAVAQNISLPFISRPLFAGEIDGRWVCAESMAGGAPLTRLSMSSFVGIDPADAALLIKRLALGLFFTHRRGFYHHDISLENVYSDPRGNVEIKRFVISGVRRAPEKDGMAFPSAPPYFTSPEKAAGLSEGPGGDIFSLGVLFYFLLTGKYPFERRNPGESEFSLVKAPGASGSVSLPTPHPLSNLERGIDERLCRLVMKMLHPIPSFRPAAEHVADVISLALARLDRRSLSIGKGQMTRTKTMVRIPRSDRRRSTGKILAF